MATTTYLHKNQGTATNAKKFTYSVWFKRAKLGNDVSGAYQRLYQGYASGDDRFYIMFEVNDTFFLFGNTGGTQSMQWAGSRKFRDTSGWYHLVLRGDSTQGSADDRFRVYINGVLETGWSKTTTIGQNIDFGNMIAQSNNTLTISGTESHTQLFEGSMSHIHFCDGQSYAPTEFGETDSNGVWKIKTSPSVTYGNTGYFILKDGNSVTDQSGNSNNFTVGAGTLTNDKDNPSNVFATMNPLIYAPNANTYTNGNTKVEGTDANWRQSGGTLGMTSGKFYWEGKYINSNDHNGTIGIKESVFANQGNDNKGGTTNGYNGLCYTNDGVSLINNTSSGGAESYGSKYGYTGSSWIMSVALDLDNNKLYFAQNGVWQNSGVPTSGSTGTGALSVASASGGDGVWLPFNSTHKSAWEMNFGNGYFGTTAVSSAGTNASENGVFEYDVPTGYTALCTKGLNGE